MPHPLTELERDVLDYLVEYVREHTYQPSVREIGARFRIKSTKTVSELLQSLADKGWLERDPARSRGVKLLGLDLRADVVSVPHVDVHLKDAALGDPVDSLSLDRRIAGSAACFMITMVGDSLRDAGIWDGDLLVVEPVERDEAEEGDLIVERSGGESFVRRYRRRPDPAAPAFGDRTDPASILGRVVAVIRRLRTDAPAGLVPEERAREGAIAT